MTRHNARRRGQCRRQLVVVFSLVIPLLAPAVAHATHVSEALDIAGKRTPMPNEGYLLYEVNPIVGRAGEEYSGWIDIQHPSSAGANDLTLGYDRSDHFVTVNTTILDDGTAVAPNPATPSRANDFDFANRAWMQGGLSVIESFQGTFQSGTAVGAPPQPLNFNMPLANTTPNPSVYNDGPVRAALNSPVGTIDTYYTTTNDANPNVSLRGYAYYSSVNNPAVFVATQGKDAAAPDTFAHELGHFLLNGPSVDNPIVGNTGHSGTVTNLMASGSIRYRPGLAKDGLGAAGSNNPPWNIANSIQVVGLPSSTNMDGSPKVGGVNQLTGGGGAQSQIERVFDNVNNTSTTQYITHTDNFAAGDYVDWDFVADHGQLEGVTGNFGDNHSGGRDRLYFRPRKVDETVVLVSPQAGKNKTGLEAFAATPDFPDEPFRTADIFSLATRYADLDVDDQGNSTIRAKSLDYTVVFRDAGGTEYPGTPVAVFEDGWTDSTSADNYLARWLSPVPAVEIFIQGINTADEDFNAQIDAVIVSSIAIPEPSSLILLSIGTAVIALAARRRRRRWHAHGTL